MYYQPERPFNWELECALKCFHTAVLTGSTILEVAAVAYVSVGSIFMFTSLERK